MKYLSMSLILIGASVAVSSPALAAYYGRNYPAAYDPYYRNYDSLYPNNSRDSFYIGGDVGLGRLSTPDEVLYPPDGNWIVGASYANESVAAGGTVGFQHAVNRQFLVGVEAGYDYNGYSKYVENYKSNITWTDSTTYRFSSQDIHVLGTATVLFHSGFNIFVKGGAARVDQRLRITDQVQYSNLPFFIGEASAIAYRPMAAAGVGYQFRAVEIYTQYSHIFAKDPQSFQDFITPLGYPEIVSVDTYKVGMAVHIKV